jgi:hypothetical protein
MGSPIPDPDRRHALRRGATYTALAVLWTVLLGKLPETWTDYFAKHDDLTVRLLFVLLCLPGLAGTVLAMAQFSKARAGRWDGLGIGAVLGLMGTLPLLLIHLFLILIRIFGNGDRLFG